MPGRLGTTTGDEDTNVREETAMSGPDNATVRRLLAELGALRERVAGVRGCVVAGVDWLVILDDASHGSDPFNVAALAAAMAGVGRQVGMALRQGEYLDCAIHGRDGYFVVYAVTDAALLTVLGDGNLNVALLNLEIRGLLTRLAELLATGALMDNHNPLLMSGAG